MTRYTNCTLIFESSREDVTIPCNTELKLLSVELDDNYYSGIAVKVQYVSSNPIINGLIATIDSGMIHSC